MLRIFLISVFLIFSNLAFGKYISFLDPKSEFIISKYLGKKFLIGNANYSFLFWDIYDAELYSTSKKYNSNELAIILKYNRSIDKETLIRETISKLTGFDFLAGKKEVEDGLESAQTNVLKAQNELAESANLFSDAENFGLPEPPGFDVPTETTVNAQKDETGTTDPLEKDQLETSEKEIDSSIEGISNNLSIGDGEEVVEEDEVQDENTSEDNLIEGIATEVGQLNTKDPIGKDSGSSSSDTSAVSGEALQDPRDLLRKKQEESIKSKRRRRRGSSFLGTPDSVNNINQRVASNKLDTDPYRGEVVASIEITDEMKAAALNPVKKVVNVQGQRKSKNTVVIVEKPVEIASSSASGMTSGAKSNIVTQGVNEEKMLLNMQSTSTLKYT